MNFEGAKQFILSKLREELPDYLSYHNLAHVEDVYQVTLQLCKAEGVSTHQTLLAATAALFHDTGFTVSRENHESISCSIARHYLTDYDYSENDIEIICKAIMATRMDIPPTDIVAQIVCDADLDYLGRPDFEMISTRLFQELLHFGLVHDVDDFDRKQIVFFETHRYYTRTAIAHRDALKQENLSKIKTRILNRTKHASD